MHLLKRKLLRNRFNQLEAQIFRTQQTLSISSSYNTKREEWRQGRLIILFNQINNNMIFLGEDQLTTRKRNRLKTRKMKPRKRNLAIRRRKILLQQMIRKKKIHLKKRKNQLLVKKKTKNRRKKPRQKMINPQIKKMRKKTERKKIRRLIAKKKTQRMKRKKPMIKRKVMRRKLRIKRMQR